LPLKDAQINNLFQARNITEDKLTKLKQMGIDLYGHLSRGEAPDERVDAAMVDMVIIGKVISIVDTPGLSSEPFHSKVNVEVVDILKGPNSQETTIELLRQSGPITDHGTPLNALYTNEPKYSIGETSVFFLSNIYHNPYLTTRYSSFFSKKQLNPKNPVYWVHSQSKLEIIGSNVSYYGRTISLEAFKSRIKSVSHIMDEPQVK
jgi:hypothetical protein